MKEEWKVYIRGNKDRGEEVIKVLEDCGASNSCGYIGDYDAALYFINHNGIIDSTRDYNAEFAKIIMSNYTELHLPEKWKDGDILVDRNDSLIMAIYEFVSDKDADLFNAYVRLNGVMITSNTLEVRKRFRLATDQEVKGFYEILHENHKDWDAEKKEVIDWKWKPQIKERYYYIDNDGEIMSETWGGFPTDDDRYDFGNCFRTKKKTEVMAEKIRKLLNAKS